MSTIIYRILKDKFVGFISYTFGSIVLVLMYVALLPSITQSSAQFNEIMKSLPESLTKIFGLGGSAAYDTLEGLLAMKQYNLVWPMLLMFFFVSMAGAMIAGEVENRTIEIVMSSSLSRFKIFVSKYIAGLIYLILFVVLTTLSAIPLAKLYGYAAQNANYFSLMYLSLALGFAVYGISILLSSIFSSKGKVNGLSGLIYIGMYVLFIVVSLKDSLSKLKYLSFFYYYNVNDALIFNKLNMTSILIFIALGLLTSLAALAIFETRDFAV